MYVSEAANFGIRSLIILKIYQVFQPTFKNKIRDWNGSGCSCNIVNDILDCMFWATWGGCSWRVARVQRGRGSWTGVFLGSQWAGLDFGVLF